MDSVLSKASRQIADKLLQVSDLKIKDVLRIKNEVACIYELGDIPRNSDILSLLNEEEYQRLLPLLRRKMARIMSGVSVVAVMTKPYPCPHGRCSYCPGGPEEKSPQSYTGYEPAALRGKENDYDPYKQVKVRIKQLRSIGHVVDKVDLIVMGGTFPASPFDYQEMFIKGCLDALAGSNSSSFDESKQRAAHVGIRNVGITVETRPDCVKNDDIDSMLKLGVTRVELGVQTIFDDIYYKVNRGHSVNDVIDATRRLKDSALKVCYHMMPGLPGSNQEVDLNAFKTLFEDQCFKPDMLKIYPTLVVKGTKLYEEWKRGEYTPYTTKDAVELISKVKEITPPWIRIMRVQRDIPLPKIDAGVDKGNLRQLVQENLVHMGKRCRCIRCREASNKNDVKDERIEIIDKSYEASDGIEIFISAEDPVVDTLIGFLRLRIPNTPHRIEITKNASLVRELHVYGRMVPVGERKAGAWQHKGWGKALMNKAERITVEKYGMDKVIVMSALGTKEYYRQLGYKPDGLYMSKMV